jgi:ABC-type dipeptide/oligopeptide/nickel transport system ATPase subunit
VSPARALITNPAILVLDDATSAVDAGIEALTWCPARLDQESYPGVVGAGG